MANSAVQLSDYQHVAAGKVRELYRVRAGLLLILATDRISAYDHVLANPVPDKGRILTAMTAFWFDLLADACPNHLVSLTDERIPVGVTGRAMLVRELAMLPVECVARGYLSGSGWAEYRETGAVCGVALPPGLAESDALPEPIFTPATKAAHGEHDQNVTFDTLVGIVGAARADQARELTLQVYRRAAAHAASRGLLLADTKLEFGVPPPGGRSATGGTGDGADLVLADEVLTPDSSRFWPAAGYRPGGPQPSFDKQYLRDWLTSPDSGWDRLSDRPPPQLPPRVVDATRSRYVQAYELISGRRFADWPGGAG